MQTEGGEVLQQPMFDLLKVMMLHIELGVLI